MTLQRSLTTLEAAGLIREAESQPELAYLFRHALVQDAAYESLVRQDRQRLHHVVGEALEQSYADRPDEVAPILGRHFSEAGDWERAARYYARAGEAALSQYANQEAVTHFGQALQAALASRPLASPQVIHLYSRRGRAMELNSQFEAALANYEEMEALARAQHDRAMLLAALVSQAQTYCTANLLFDIRRGEPLCVQSLELAQELGDRETEARIHWIRLNGYRLTGRPEHALQAGERALALARELGLRERLAYTLNDLAHVYEVLGRTPESLEALREASSLWRELGNLPMLADSLASTSSFHAMIGRYDEALKYSDDAYEISLITGNLWGQSYSRFHVGVVYWDRGQVGRAITVMDETIRLAEQAGFLVPRVVTRGWLALVYGYLGAVDHGVDVGRLALEVMGSDNPLGRRAPLAWLAQLHLWGGDAGAARELLQEAQASPAGEPGFDIFVYLVGSQLALLQGEAERALVLAEQAGAELRELGWRSFVPDALLWQGRTLWALNRAEAACARLEEGRAAAEALGSRRTLWQLLAALSQCAAERGHQAEARALRTRAHEIIDYIADQTPTPELRASFLDRRDVRAVIHGG